MPSPFFLMRLLVLAHNLLMKTGERSIWRGNCFFSSFLSALLRPFETPILSLLPYQFVGKDAELVLAHNLLRQTGESMQLIPARLFKARGGI
jgi:hypothetical protein